MYILIVLTLMGLLPFDIALSYQKTGSYNMISGEVALGI